MKKADHGSSHIRLQNISGQDWSKANLSDIIFDCNLTEKMNLQRANLKGITAHASAFTTVNFRNANFRNAKDITGSLFHGCKMQNTNFAGANLAGTLFYQCDLSQANFSGAQLRGAIFNECVGQRIQFNNAHLQDTVFTSVQFSGANLCGAKADRLSIVQSAMPKTIFSNSREGLFQARALVVRDSNIQNSSFEGAYLYRAHFSGDLYTHLNARGVSFKKANLINSYFAADLTGADFTLAQADYTHFIQSNCVRAHFKMTRLRGATLIKSQFTKKLYSPAIAPAWIDRCSGIKL